LELSDRVEVENKINNGFKSLIFIKSHNTVETIVAYLSNLKAGNLVYLYDSDDVTVINKLIDIYKPNALVSEGKYTILHSNNLNIHADTSLLLSTSGSTGTPKFVKLSADNINSNAISIADYLGLTCNDRALAHLKLHYSFGLSILNSHLIIGASVVLTNASVLDDEFGEVINKHQITSFSGVPFIFQSLDKISFDLKKYPSLRQITQAGGKLYKEDVLKWNKKSKKQGIEFYVMYGQTEASPRISYLPPKFIDEFPDSIGVAIPGGKIYIVNENKEIITDVDVEGELVYEGPNVMQGYASKLSHLSTGGVTSSLYTGDIAKLNKSGVFSIVGRSSRFVKLFGIRINLDDVEELFNIIKSGVICTGNDQIIVVAATDNYGLEHAVTNVAKKLKLPESYFKAVLFKNIPLLANGKIDYKTILNSANSQKNVFLKSKDLIISRKFWCEFFNETLKVTGIVKENLTIEGIFKQAFPSNSFNAFSFKDLGGDSMSYVTISMQLEELIGFIPEQWELLTIGELIKLEAMGENI